MVRHKTAIRDIKPTCFRWHGLQPLVISGRDPTYREGMSKADFVSLVLPFVNTVTYC